MKLLSLRLCEHDSNISYFDGNELYYYKLERESQIKHDAYNNLHDWKNTIKRLWNVDHRRIDEIAIVIDPWKHKLPTNNENFFPAVDYGHIPTPSKVYRVNHHYAHALSGWPEGDSDIQIVIDGFGDKDISWTVFSNDRILDHGSVIKNGSLGLSMCDAGQRLGIKSKHPLDIAGKLMGLQSYGKYSHEFADIISKYDLSNVNALFDFDKWIEYKKDDLLADHTKLDWIRTVHRIAGRKLVEFFSLYAKPTDKILYSGGVAQNIIWNTKLKKYFPNLITIPHCNDEGLSLGGIEWLRRKNNLPPFTLKNYPFCQSDEYAEPLESNVETIAKYLSEGKIVGWYQYNGEIGPRALGNRSILMDPRIKNGKEKINRLKNRENYRPFGASVLKTEKDIWFENLPDNPYMTYSAKVKDDFPSITHVDGTCRVQTVDETNGTFYNLLTEFHKQTGCPILLNTSLNEAGKPIVSNKQDCYNYFMTSDMDCLVLGNKIYIKDDRRT